MTRRRFGWVGFPCALTVLLIAAPSALAVPPANDEAPGADPLADTYPSLSTTVADITDATLTGDPPTPSCTNSLSRSVWFKITPSATRDYRVATAAVGPEGNSATTVDDTVLAIYTSAGGAAGPFTELPTNAGAGSDGCDDDGAATEPGQSTLVTELQGGTEYWVVVWKFGAPAPTVGNTAIQLRIDQLPLIAAPANDKVAGAIDLKLNKPAPATYGAAANDYTLPAASPCYTGVGQVASTAAGRDVVYRFTAPSAGDYAFRLTGLIGGANPVAYVSGSLPGPGPPQDVTCIAASNRSVATRIEEVSPLTLTAGQVVFMVVDQNIGAPKGGTFDVLVERSVSEGEPNDTTGTAQAPSCGTRGATSPAAEADFFTLGAPPSGSRLFAFVEAGATSNPDFDLRATTATDTLEYDDENASGPFGETSAVLAGTPLTGGGAFIRVNHFDPLVQAEPYRLYSVIQPPIASATAETEPNNTIVSASTSAINYVSADLDSLADIDVYAFTLPARALVFVGLDTDPLRDNTPFDGTLLLADALGNPISGVDDGSTTSGISSVTASPGTLTGTTPFSPAEGLVYRTPTAGTYYAAVEDFGGVIGDYLLSVSAGCAAGAAAPPLNVSPATLPNATVGTAYSQTLTASGSAGPFTFGLDSGSLPPGLTLAANGNLTGTPSASGPSTFTVIATDPNSLTGDREYTLTVNPGAGGGGTTGDRTAPETTITAGPKKKTTKKKATFEFSSSEPRSTFECALDKGALASCTSPLKTKKLRPGKHTFSVRAKDAAGNVDATPATQSFKVKKPKKK